MLTLHTSNQTERLVETLIRALHRPNPSLAERFETQYVVVPNANTRAYLQFAIAQQLGIAANLHFDTLPALLARLTAHTERKVPTRGHVQAALLQLLNQSELLEQEGLAPVRRYLELASKNEELTTLRRFQLARELSGYLMRYRIERDDLTRAWLQGEYALPSSARETESWQAILYRALFGPKGVFSGQSEDGQALWLSLAELLDALPDEAVKLPKVLHVFGLSYTSTEVLDALLALGKRCQVQLYLLHPCRELAPATNTLSRRALTELTTLHHELRADPSPLLRLWATPLRLHQQLLVSEGGCTVVPHEVEPFEKHPCLLTRLQQDLLERLPESISAKRPRLPPDGSLQLLACPSIQRELESIACAIWEMVAQSHAKPDARPLNFNDIAVVVVHSKKDAYLTRVDAVFKAAHNLPHNIIDLRPQSSSRYVEALLLLLALPFTELRRNDLLALLTHPNVARRWDEADSKLWERWCSELGIVHGADHADHLDTYLDTDVLNWDQGVRRLVLGAFMAGPRSNVETPVEIDGHSYLPHESAREQLAAVSRFAVLLRSLIADVRTLRKLRCSLSRWGELLSELAEHYLLPDRDDPIPGRCRRVFQELGETGQAPNPQNMGETGQAPNPQNMGETGQAPNADLGDQNFPYRVAYEWIRAALAELQVERGQYLCSGVVVSSFLPLRPIPFRVIFVAGLGEGLFPSPSHSSPLDLRAAAARPTDVTPREAERALFLETLLLARERLLLSYVAKDAQTGAKLQPSAVVDELMGLLERAVLTRNSGREALTVHVPLRRYDPVAFSPSLAIAPHHHLPAAVQEHDAAKQRAALLELWPKDSPLPSTRAEVEPVLTHEAKQELYSRLRFPTPILRPHAQPRDRVELSATALRKFLECPVQAAAKYVLGMWERVEDDVYDKLDEDFELAFFDQLNVLGAVFNELLSSSAPLEESATRTAYRAHASKRQASGRGPYGVFAEGQEERDLQVLNAWLAALEYKELDLRRPFTTLRFGRAERCAASAAQHPALSLELTLGAAEQPCKVELSGTTSLMSQDTTLLVVAKTAAKPKNKPPYWLGPYLDHLMLTAAGLGEHERRAVVFGTEEVAEGSFSCMTMAEAHAKLIALTSELLGGVHHELLPIDVVVEALKKHEKEGSPLPAEDFVYLSILDKLDSHAESPDFVRLASIHGPIRELTRLSPPSPPALAKLLNGRLADILATVLNLS